MKHKISSVASLLCLVALTFFFIRFFFPSFLSFLSIPFLFSAFVVFVLLSIFTFDPKKLKKDRLIGLPITLYFAGLIIVLQLIGGSTDTPLSIHQPFLWIAIAIGVWLDIKRIRDKKKVV